MATLTLQNVPPAVLADLTARAARANRTVEEEVVARLEAEFAARPGNDDTGPCDFLRPLMGPAVSVTVQVGGERLPAVPVILDPTPQ